MLPPPAPISTSSMLGIRTGSPLPFLKRCTRAISNVLVDRARCPMLVAKVRVVNHGQVPLRPGTRIVLRSGYGVVVGSTNTQRPLQPGSAQMLEVPIEGTSGEVTVIAEVDTDDRTAECREDNNTFGPVRLSCAE